MDWNLCQSPKFHQNPFFPNVDRFNSKWVQGIVDEVKKYQSLWKNPMEFESELEMEKQMSDIAKIAKNLTTKFGKCYTPSETFAKWMELKKYYFSDSPPSLPILEKMKFLGKQKESASPKKDPNGPLFYDMPDISTISANSTALAPLFDKPLRASKKIPSEVPKKVTVISKNPSDPVVISLNEAFDPPNIGDIVCTGTFTAPTQSSYQRYQPAQNHYQASAMNVQYHHPYHRPPIMSQKKKRQITQNPHQQMVYSWNPAYHIPFAPNQFPSISTQPTPDFDDFDPEKAAEEMFFNKITEE